MYNLVSYAYNDKHVRVVANTIQYEYTMAKELSLVVYGAN